jgi:replicative superfamily II helicase
VAVLATFIGINKYADAQIRDLGGARRDATALWALFSDTLAEAQARLLVDEEATVEGIRRAFDATLGAAGPDDTVILSFSGHGTHDHRLVVADTVADALLATTIPMQELADRFKGTRAKIVLCILDCCFSGGAPARVLEHSPVPRDVRFSFNAIAGKGRILIAAANLDEVAWELPGTGHGLLTKALIDVFREADGPIGLPTAMDRVTELVRAEANRIGVRQTPVHLGYVEGGFTFPALRPGARFYEKFPELRGHRVSKNLHDLAVFGLPASILAAWADRFKGGLNDLQLAAVNDRRILDGNSLLVVAPTSSGKTFIGELAATRAVISGRKAVFLLPYRALVNEKYDQFADLYGAQLDMRVIRCTGDYTDATPAFMLGKYDVALLTYEMFLNLVVRNRGLLNQMGLVVLDEAQFITDPNRGITVELLLTFLITAREQGIAPQVIALSAVIGDINSFDQWLGCDTLITTARPVPLVEGVLDRSGVYQFLDQDGTVREEQLLPWGAVQQRGKQPSSQDVIVPLVRNLLREGAGAKVIVFRNQRGNAQGCARYLARDLGLPPATEALALLPTSDPSSASAVLRECLGGGTAFHTSNLNRDERQAVEQTFRDPQSKVRVLAATTTVAAGINTPASVVILAEQEFLGEDGRRFTVAEYKNMAGRAGRLGYNEAGQAIILADNVHQRRELFSRYVTGQLEPFQSPFDPQHLETWVVRLLVQIDQVPRDEVGRLLANTYGGYLANRTYPEWQGEIALRIEDVLARMEGLGLVEQEGGRVGLTLLGRACGESALSFSSAMRLVETLHRVGPHQLTAGMLMALVQLLPEADGGYTPMFKRGTTESRNVGLAAARYGRQVVQVLQVYSGDLMNYYARCKRAALLWDWIQGTPVEEIERRYTVNPFSGQITHGDVRRFADTTRYHLRSAFQIASITFMGEGPGEEEIEALLRQLEVGIPAEALGLLALPIPLGRGEYLVLYNAGSKTPDDVFAARPEVVTELLGPARARQVVAARSAQSVPA